MRFPSISVALTLALLVGCGPAATGKGTHVGLPDNRSLSAEVTDEAYASAVRELLLSEPGSQERQARLSGVLAKQMSRALEAFKHKEVDRGLSVVAGGLYLVRTGELTKDTLGQNGKDALTAAVHPLAQRGDEGRSRALYEVLLRTVAPADQADVKSHLDALSTWQKDDDDSSLLAASSNLDRAIERRLLEPSQSAVDDAVAAAYDWYQRALGLRNVARTRGVSAQEKAEAVRALQTAGSVIVAIYLRDGDAAGAVAAIDKHRMRDTIPRHLLSAIDDAAGSPNAKYFVEVLRALFPDSDSDDIPIDRNLLRGAAFGVASQAFRLDPTSPEGALAVAEAMQSLGMAEAAPTILSEAVQAHPDVRFVGIALQLTLRAMASASDVDDAAAARRTFKSAKTIMDIADTLKPPPQPSPARVRALMGDIELQEGRLDVARELIKATASVDGTGRSLYLLAQIEVHDNDITNALGHLTAAATKDDAMKDVALRADILVYGSDVAADKGDATLAKKFLEDALRALLNAQTNASPVDRARIERALASTLDRFGQSQAADRAIARAFDATPRDKAQISLTARLAIGRSLVKGDLPKARDALSRALTAELDTEDLVYYSLWVHYLEKQSKAKDPLSDRVFQTVPDDGRWIGRLAAYAQGKIKPEELVASATSEAKKMEALFYTAMDKRALGTSVDDSLKQIAQGSAIELMETSLAKDLLRPRPPLPLPTGVTIP